MKIKTIINFSDKELKLLDDTVKLLEEFTLDEVLSIIDYANGVDPVIHAVLVCKWECSNCGFDATEEKLKWKFCPNCGVKIETEGEL